MIEIKILGSGCTKCIKLADLAKEAVAEMGLQASIEKVTEMQEIISYGVMRTPGLVVNGEVKISGRLPSKENIMEILQTV